MKAVDETVEDPSRRNRAGELVVYGAVGCHLCNEAMDVLATLAPELGLTVRYVTIDGDPELESSHRTEIPVGYVGQRKLFKYRVDPVRLRRVAERLAARHETLAPELDFEA